MKNKQGGFYGVIVALFFGVIAFFTVIAFTGLHIETGKGSHVGYITATETSGLIFKTGTAYVKTDTQSSQEDNYCVIDDSLLAELSEVSERKEKVKVSYISYFSSGIANCNAEGAIITGFSELE